MLTCERRGDAIDVGGELQVQYLDSLKQCLLRELNSPDLLVLDFSAVTEVDLAGLQFLLAFALDRRKHGSVKYVNLPLAMDKALELSGLESRLRPFRG